MPESKSIVIRALKPADDSLTSQAMEIVKAIHDNGGSMKRKDLVAVLKTRLKTKQPAGRVLSFYRPQLVRDKYIVVERG